MAADGVAGTKGNPHFLGPGALATAVDYGIISDWAADNIDRMVTNIAARDALTPRYNGMIAQTSTEKAMWRCTDSVGNVWQQIGISTGWADATARDTAIPAPPVGMRTQLDTENFARIYRSSTWVPCVSEVAIIPTITSTGGSVAVSADGEITGTGAITQLNATLPLPATFKLIESVLCYVAATGGQHTVKLLAAGTPDATASSYRGQTFLAAGGSTLQPALTPGTSWAMSSGRLEKTREMKIRNLGVAKVTRIVEVGGDSEAVTTEAVVLNYLRHTNPVALDGIRLDFSGLGSFSELSWTFKGKL